MSWGAAYMYYHCDRCGKKFKTELSLIPVLGDNFGRCPACLALAVYERDGAILPGDELYEDVDESSYE